MLNKILFKIKNWIKNKYIITIILVILINSNKKLLIKMRKLNKYLTIKLGKMK